jgi:hypothetical protein
MFFDDDGYGGCGSMYGRLGALRTAIDEGDASGVSKATFSRVRETLDYSLPSPISPTH